MNNFARSIDMLNAAVLIDPENKQMIRNITELRDKFVVDLVSRLERDIEGDFPDKYVEIEKMITVNDLKRAEKLVDEFHSEEAETPKALYVKGLLLYRNGNLKESVKCFDRASGLESVNEKTSIMKSNAETLLKLVDQAAKEMGELKYRDAVKTLTKALAVDKDNRIINQASYFQRALANFNAGFVEASFDDYKKFDLLKKVIGNAGMDFGAALTKPRETEEKNSSTSEATETKKCESMQEHKESTEAAIEVSVKKIENDCTKTEPVFEFSSDQFEIIDPNAEQQSVTEEIEVKPSSTETESTLKLLDVELPLQVSEDDSKEIHEASTSSIEDVQEV